MEYGCSPSAAGSEHLWRPASAVSVVGPSVAAGCNWPHSCASGVRERDLQTDRPNSMAPAVLVNGGFEAIGACDALGHIQGDCRLGRAFLLPGSCRGEVPPTVARDVLRRPNRYRHSEMHFINALQARCLRRAWALGRVRSYRG
jgi:hypothetical protein